MAFAKFIPCYSSFSSELKKIKLIFYCYLSLFSNTIFNMWTVFPNFQTGIRQNPEHSNFYLFSVHNLKQLKKIAVQNLANNLRIKNITLFNFSKRTIRNVAFILTRKIAALPAAFYSSCGGLQSSPATVGPFGPNNGAKNIENPFGKFCGNVFEFFLQKSI